MEAAAEAHATPLLPSATGIGTPCTQYCTYLSERERKRARAHRSSFCGGFLAFLFFTGVFLFFLAEAFVLSKRHGLGSLF